MDSTASSALEQIREGGTRLILSAQAKLAEIRKQLDEGDFMEAHTTGEQLSERLAALASAQSRLGRVAEGCIVAAADAEVGMVTEGGQTITSIEPCPCEVEGCEKRLFTFSDGGEVALPPDMEFIVGAD